MTCPCIEHMRSGENKRRRYCGQHRMDGNCVKRNKRCSIARLRTEDEKFSRDVKR